MSALYIALENIIISRTLSPVAMSWVWGELSRRAITTSYHDELSRRAITTSYHDEIDASGPRVLVILLDRLSNQLTTTVSYTVQMHR
jgi:hypothetical protein